MKKNKKTFIIQDHTPLFTDNSLDGVELLAIQDALKEYTWLKENYFWQAISKITDASTQAFDDENCHGYFLRVKAGSKVSIPYNIGLHLHTEGFEQTLHNIVLIEDNASLELITTCLSQENMTSGAHISVDEYYIGENANFSHTMIHNWHANIDVKPHASTIVGKNSRYEENYIALKTPRFIANHPKTYLNGEGSSAKLLSVIHGQDKSIADVGGDVYMNGDHTSAELVHRAISTGGMVLQKGLLIANAPSRAHVDCAGILLTDGTSGEIESIPGIRTYHPDAKMSHEASIGKISPAQIEYLQTKGMSETEATAFLIRGFIGHGISKLGQKLDDEIADIIILAGHGECKED